MAEERTILDRAWDGVKAAVKAIPRAIMWTAGFFGLSYAAGKVAKDEKFDFMGVAQAFEGKTQKDREEGLERLTKRGALSLALSMGISGGLSALVGTPAPGGEANPQAQAGLPKNNAAPSAGHAEGKS